MDSNLQMTGEAFKYRLLKKSIFQNPYGKRVTRIISSNWMEKDQCFQYHEISHR